MAKKNKSIGFVEAVHNMFDEFGKELTKSYSKPKIKKVVRKRKNAKRNTRN